MSEQPKHRQNDEFPAFCTCLSRWPCDFALEQALARIADLERAQAVADATIARLTTEWHEMAGLLRDRSPLFQDYEDVKAALAASEQRAARLVEAGDAMADAIAGLLIVGSVSWRAGAIAMSDWGVARAALAGSAVAAEQGEG